ncbi:hypothetical protein MTR67_025367 [Solanum verrucosum]|uniref:Uncharacterized protein n=1 Tax=Solanum verrucosum TaxID=315347 RepID=A0AAF0R0W1_SOLVR|nr:hypothetical protein MTR67_025367 [Solanum verrucosum]
MVKGRQGECVRLYTRGTVLGYKRSKSNQYPNTSLVQIKGVSTKEEVDWPHGNSGVVRAKFNSNLPPNTLRLEFSCTQATYKQGTKSMHMLERKWRWLKKVGGWVKKKGIFFLF